MTNAAALRKTMERNELTQPEIAELAEVSLKTVESWLAEESAASHRRMPARHLSLIAMRLPRYMAARNRRKE